MVHSKALFKKLTAYTLVSAAQGSWKWQTPYLYASYEAYATNDGRVLFKSVWNSGKVSWPQIKKAGDANMPTGSQHNKPVDRQEAVNMIGIQNVKSLEGRGFIFSEKEV